MVINKKAAFDIETCIIKYVNKSNPYSGWDDVENSIKSIIKIKVSVFSEAVII